MHASRFWVSTIAAAAALACGGETPLDPDDGGGTPVVVELDMYQPSGGTASATGPMVAVGQTAHIRVEGTYSIWSGEWDNGTCAGTSEPAPMIPSAGSTNGTVGIDAEFYFAIPQGSSLCSESAPKKSSGFRISLDGGADYDGIDPITPAAAPTADHVYEYLVEGQGHPIRLQREDSPSDDNYGVLKFTITVD